MQIERITHSPTIMGGKPCIRGLRVTVGTILGLLASGKSRERILQAYPYLEPQDIDAALAYAAWRLEGRTARRHMSVHLVVDMNLSVEWVAELASHKEAVEMWAWSN